jgi:protein-S-isoprenylcysteine O-methyltransferase Ste14
MLRDWLLAAASVACLGSFTWALRGHFRREGPIPLGMRLLSAASLAGFCLYLCRLRQVHPPPGLLLSGLALFALSLCVFWWAVASTRAARLHLAHSDADPQFLTTSGAYRLIRHPFYVAYMIFWLATALSAGGAQWLVTAVLVTWYVQIARYEERRFGASAMDDAYRAYRERTGMLLPALSAGKRRPSGA